MILSSLLDLGAPLDRLQADLGRMGLEGLSVATERVGRHGMSANHMVLSWTTPRSLRHLHDILHIIEGAGLPDRVVERSRAVLEALGRAEAQVHGVALDHVHFHEIGAVDTIVDIVGAALCLEYLSVSRVTYSTLVDGHGAVKTAHGVMPVPVPATARLIAGKRLRTVDIESELLTPTGAAILTTLGEQVDVMPEGVVSAAGIGCGDREFHGAANVLRAFMVAEGGPGSVSRVCVLESDMDHVSGEVMAFAAQECMDAGALDVTWSPVYMKKGRPGYRLGVVCEVGAREALTDIVMRQTRTLGVRWHIAERAVASRELQQGSLLGQAIDEKLCTYKGESFRKIEYEALAALARSRQRPLPEILEEYLRSRA
jgi:uncharacterized protein (TIGR00299 family) protein